MFRSIESKSKRRADLFGALNPYLETCSICRAAVKLAQSLPALVAFLEDLRFLRRDACIGMPSQVIWDDPRVKKAGECKILSTKGHLAPGTLRVSEKRPAQARSCLPRAKTAPCPKLTACAGEMPPRDLSAAMALFQNSKSPRAQIAGTAI